MKKLILTFALALFSQSFADCIHTVFEYEQATIADYDKSFDGLLFDSMYVDKGTANTRGNSIYILKYYRTAIKSTAPTKQISATGNGNTRLP
jgi:hypothetical protein